MGSKEHDSALKDESSEKNNYEGKFNTLRIISLKAINEFEDLQKKCEENYSKYLEERENYLRTKKELDVLKEVSGEALGEYENLHRKFAIEQECRDKAEEYAMQQVKANKQLKRQSTILLNTLVAKAVDFDLDELASETDSDSSLTEDHGVFNKQIEGLKQQVESLKIQTDKISLQLHVTEEKLKHEVQEHTKTKEELENNKVNFKQLNRVSMLALDDYSNLQQKYEMEMQYRAQAEKLAVEEPEESVDKESTANRDHEAVVKQSEFMSKELSGEERLEKALEEISNLTKKLHQQKTEFDNKVKELEEELASSNDVQKLKSLEEKINTFAQGMETLETRLTQAQQRASEAETKAKKLEELLKKAQTPDAIPPPAPPPPPPPPPAPAQLLKKFVGIITTGGGKKNYKKRGSKSSLKEDPRVKAMSEMMERIKNGKVELKKIAPRETLPNDNEGSAMENLRDVLKSIKSPTKDDNDIKSEDEQKMHTFGVQLRKVAERKPRSHSDGAENDFKAVTLRKPRSQSTGDMLEDDTDKGLTMDKDLYKLLQKQKVAAEREENPQGQQQNGATEQQTGETSEENGKSS